jgi:hypothetical protein
MIYEEMTMIRFTRFLAIPLFAASAALAQPGQMSAANAVPETKPVGIGNAKQAPAAPAAPAAPTAPVPDSSSKAPSVPQPSAASAAPAAPSPEDMTDAKPVTSRKKPSVSSFDRERGKAGKVKPTLPTAAPKPVPPRSIIKDADAPPVPVESSDPVKR